jgi:hypothetical protein
MGNYIGLSPILATLKNELEVSLLDLISRYGANTIAFSGESLGAFGDLETMEMTPICHLSFCTGIRSQLINSTIANNGTVDTNASRLRLQTGTSNNGSAIVSSVKPVGYRPGQGITARMTPAFSTFASNSKQIFGMGNEVDGYFWGYNGIDFGIFHRYNSNDTFIAQSSWNADTCNGSGSSEFTLDPTKGVPMMIKYPFLGYGNIRFFIQNPATSGWILVHTIKYANSSNQVQLTNPILNVYGQVINSGSTTNLTMYVGSVGVFIDGPKIYLGPQFGTEAGKSISQSVETQLLTLKNCTTINSVANRGLIRLRYISILSQSGNGYVTVRFKRNCSLTNPTFTPISASTANNGTTLTNAQSTISVDTVASAFSGGVTIFNSNSNTSNQHAVDLTSFDIFLAPTETLTITAYASAATTFAIAINWQEDVQ